MSKKQPFHQGEWEFTFPNGDIYKGHYCAHISGLAWRQGPGTYITHDGQLYEGNWKDDKLNEAENLKITFQSRDQYSGKIHKYKYNGPGTYSFRYGDLSCNFVNNRPSGDVIYVDYHGQIWKGYGTNNHVLLKKEHIFSYELDSDRGKGRPKVVERPKIPEITEDGGKSDEISVDMKEQERQVFAKSTKTPADIDLEDSDWYRQYQKFAEMCNKLGSHGVSYLTDEEKLLYQQYQKSAKIVKDKHQKNVKTHHQNLLRRYFEEEKKCTCPPVSVFYPTNYEVP